MFLRLFQPLMFLSHSFYLKECLCQPWKKDSFTIMRYWRFDYHNVIIFFKTLPLVQSTIYLSPIIRVLSGTMPGWIAFTASNMYLSGFPKIIGLRQAAVWTAATNAPVPKYIQIESLLSVCRDLLPSTQKTKWIWTYREARIPYWLGTQDPY